MSLSETKVRNAKAKSKPYKIADGEGLFLLVTPANGKYWRLRYFIGGKEKLLALGVYPEVSLAEARERRAQAKKVIASGADPAETKKESKRQAILSNSNSFESVAREWYANRLHEWSPSSIRSKTFYLEKHLIPKLGSKPISAITAPEVLEMLRDIESRGTLDSAKRVMQMCGQVFMYGIATGRVERNPVPDLRGAIKSPVVKHRSFLKANELPDYLKTLEGYEGNPQTKIALRFLLLTFVRTTELRAAEWTEIDWEESLWRIPEERMKVKEPHLVPLSKQSLVLLTSLQKLTGYQRFLFPNQHNPKTYMSENTMLYGLYRMGYHSRATGHGFRSTASTILNEHGFRPDVIERQLAHTERNQVRAAYNHAQYLPERRKMMQWWADYLDELIS